MWVLGTELKPLGLQTSKDFPLSAEPSLQPLLFFKMVTVTEVSPDVRGA